MGIRKDKSLPEWLTRRSDLPAQDVSESPHRQVQPRSRRATTVFAYAAMLLVSILAGVLFAGHGMLFHASTRAGTGAAATQPRVSDFPLPTTASAPDSPLAFISPLAAVGVDGSFWSVQNGGSLHGTVQIGRVSPDGKVALYSFPTSTVEPKAIAIGSNGIVWVADQGNDALWQIDPHTGAMRRFDTPEDAAAAPGAHGGNLVGLAVEPDGKVWYLTDGGQELGRLDPATGATTTLIPWNHQKSSGAIAEIATSSTSNGSLWMRLGPALVGDGVVIGRYDITTGAIQKTDITSSVDTIVEAGLLGASRIASRIVPAPDGSAWLIEYKDATSQQGNLENEIVHVLPDGSFKVYPRPQQGLLRGGVSVATDAQSNFWYLQANGDSAGSVSVIRVSPQGDFQTVGTFPGSEITPPGTRVLTIAPASSLGVVWLTRETPADGPVSKLDAIRIALSA